MLSQAQSNTPVNELSDEDLVERYSKTGDKRAFGVLYKRYANMVYGSALKYMKGEESARDMVAQVFEKLYRKLPEVEVQNFKGYLYGSVRNECIARLRQLTSERKKKEIYKLDELNNDPFMENEGLERLLSSEVSLEEKIGEAIAQLSEDQQRCIRLFFYEKRSYKEIEETTEYTLKQVKSYLQNGKRNLRNLLSQIQED